MSENGTAMVTHQEQAHTITVAGSQTFEPQSFDALMAIAEMFNESNMFPRLKGAAAIATIIVAGREYGFTAIQALRMLQFYEGKVQIPADTAVALVKRQPAICKYFICVETTDEKATYETWRVGEPEAHRLTWTIEQAKKAKLLGKDNWQNHPAAMLRARASLALARLVYPDVVGGIYDPDEMGPVEAPPAPKASTIVARRAAPVAAEAEVIPDAASSEPDNGGAVAEYAIRLAACTSIEQIDALAVEAKAAKFAGPMRAEIAGLFTTHRARLAQTAAA